MSKLFISVTHKINKLTDDFNWARVRLFDKPCCEAFLMLCQADGEAEIKSVQQKPKNKWRPQPMDTIELEKTGSRKLKLSAKTIMTIAEKLYTQGLISYPRTETNKFSNDMNLRPLVEMQTQHPDWGDFANRVLDWGPNPRNGNKSDQAHPPIHPTKLATNLQGNEKRVYELIVRHFLACVSRDAVGSETVVNATIGNEDFTASGLIILERNYLDVYIYDRWTGKEIHNYEVGQKFVPTELSLHEGATNPPNMLTEADLIALMEKHGIGTDATHAEHISKIKEREYIGELDQGHLVPGVLGMGLVEGYELMNLQLAQPRLRAGLEEDLKAICEGRKNPHVVLAEQIQKYKACYQIIEREAQELDRALGQRFGQAPQEAPQLAQMNAPATREVLLCPKCRRTKMLLKQKRDNGDFFISCQGFPLCRNAVWFSNDVKEVSLVDEACGACGGENKKLKFKFSQTSMLGLVNEVPANSRIEGTHYITCIVCDDALRRLLAIPVESVKMLGNVVGAGTRPVQQNNQPPARDPPARGFATNANPEQNQRRGWYNDDDDDQQPRGFGNGQNQNQRRGWYNDDDDDAPAGGGGAVAVGSNNRNQNWNNNQNQNWNNNQQQTHGNPSRPPVDLKKLPNVKCQCNKNAGKLVTNKAGPNQGRPFYNCASRACKFFQWADVPAQVNQRPNNFNQTAQQSGTGPKRKCGVCRQEGHTKKTCPNVQHY